MREPRTWILTVPAPQRQRQSPASTTAMPGSAGSAPEDALDTVTPATPLPTEAEPTASGEPQRGSHSRPTEPGINHDD